MDMDREIHLQEDIPNVKEESVDQSENDQETYVTKGKHEFNILHKFKVKEEDNVQDFKDDIEIKEEDVFYDSESGSNLQIDPRPKNNDRIKTAEVPNNKDQQQDTGTQDDSRPPPPSATPAAQMPASGIGSRRADPFNRSSGRKRFAKHVPERLHRLRTCENCITARLKIVKCSHKCIACNVPLCLYKCFWKYHTP